jgi:hypothetical protein
MPDNLLKKTAGAYLDNIATAGIACGLRFDITSKDGKKVFLKAGTPLTKSISEKLNNLAREEIVEAKNAEENIQVTENIDQKVLFASLQQAIINNPVLTKHQLGNTLETITQYVESETIPSEILEHLAVFSKSNKSEFDHTLTNLVFGTYIGKKNNYSATELNELISVLFSPILVLPDLIQKCLTR